MHDQESQGFDTAYLEQLRRGAELTTSMLSPSSQADRMAAAIEAGIGRAASGESPDETAIRVGVIRLADGSWWAQVEGTGDALAALAMPDAASLRATLFDALELLFAPLMSNDELAAHREAVSG